MLPRLPNFQFFTRYLLSGETLNTFRERLIKQVPLPGAGIDIDELPDGMLINARFRAAGTINLDFAAAWNGANVRVQGGRIMGTEWGTLNGNDPTSAGWTEELATIGTSTLSVSDGQTVWLAITIGHTDTDSLGLLSATGETSVTVTGGAGGGGGGGWGGGGGGYATQDAADGAAGSAGAAGAGGAGGGGGTYGVGGTATPAGDGGSGGSGGAGDAGDIRPQYTFTEYTKARTIIRTWEVTSLAFTVATTKPAASATLAHLPICKVVGSDIIQHQVGSIPLILPAVTRAAPD